MTRLLFASSNPGKLAEATLFAEQAGVELLAPKDLGIDIEVPETGTTFEANATLKTEAYIKLISDPTLGVIGDDSGLEIPALNNEPGVYSRRWNGQEMTDLELVDYTLLKMKDLHGDQRAAKFVCVLALQLPKQPIKYFRGEMLGTILERAEEGPMVSGFPFRKLFYIPEIDKQLGEIHGTTIKQRGGFMTHRERALAQAFDYITHL